MTTSIVSQTKAAGLLRRPSIIVVGIAIAVTLATGLFAELQNRTVHRHGVRAAVSEQLGLLRARLEGNINSNLQLVRGLVAVIASQPDIDQTQFSQIAGHLIGPHSQLRNIAAAPNLIISLMHPIEGNEKAIGLDYKKNRQQSKSAMQAVETRELVLAGPVNLVQGGQGFVGRFPVYVSKPGGPKVLWGLVSAVVDIDRLYTDSGLNDPSLPIDIAISGRDADLNDTTVFFGNSDLFKNDPVTGVISMPTGGWRIAAVPKGGWNTAPDNVWVVRAAILICGFLIIGPIFVAGQLYDQRQAHMLELGRRQDEMEHLSHRLELALDTSKIGIWELNLATQLLTWDERMKELYDIPKDVDPTEYNVWRESLHPDDLKRAEVEYWDAINSDGIYNSEFRVVLTDGSTRWIRAIGAVRTNNYGQRYILGVNWDVSTDVELKTRLLSAKKDTEIRNSELELARSQMEFNALHDSLTGLPNRRHLDQRLMEADVDQRPTALLHIDLDRFKQINDTLGHAAGDAMLVHAASILQANIRAGDFVARIGGDEFIIAITGPVDETKLAALAERIIAQMRQPVRYHHHQCRFGVSIGIAMEDQDRSIDGRSLLIDADVALYRAKNNGRNRFEFFSAELKAEIVHTKRVADDILSGLEQQEFLPHFQPQFDAHTLEVVGVEALARWNHPKHGLLTPDKFLKTADDLNVVPLIDRSILEQTLQEFTRWSAECVPIPRISVNVSGGRLKEAGLMKGLDGLPIKPGTLSFELLESTFLDEQDETISANFEQLREMGIDIEIDDFGTGYASILSLIHLRPARLKIDRQLIRPLSQSEEQKKLVSSIIDIGKSFDIKVVAEGVETMEHARILRDLGCDVLQGYAFAAPMPSDDLINFVREERWRSVA